MEKRYSVPAVNKMLNIIELLAEKERGCSVNELSRLTNTSVNSVYRICLELEMRNYLAKRDGLYVLGGAFCTIGKAAEKNVNLIEAALPVMKELCAQLCETVHLTMLKGDRMLLVQQIECEKNIRIKVDTGSVLFPHCSAFGKCLLAHADENYLNAYIGAGLVKLTHATIAEERALKAELQTVRSSAIAYDNEEYMEAVVCIGAPIIDKNNKCAAAVGVILPKYRYDQIFKREAEIAVRLAAKKIAQRYCV